MRILKYFIYAFAGFINSTGIDVPYFISEAKTFKNECCPRRFVFRSRPLSIEKRSMISVACGAERISRYKRMVYTYIIIYNILVIV